MADNNFTTSDTTTPTLDNTQKSWSHSLISDINQDLDAVKKVFSDILSKNGQYDVSKDFGALEISGLDAHSQPVESQAPAHTLVAPAESVLPREASSSSVSFAPPTESTPDTTDSGKPVAGGGASPEVSSKPTAGAPSISELPLAATDNLTYLDPFDSLKGIYHDLVDQKQEAAATPADTASVTADNLSIFHPIDSLKEIYHHIVGDTPAKPSDTPAAPTESPEKTHLQQVEATKITDPKERAQFEKDMGDFEKRAAAMTPPMSQDEINKTYAQVSRLMEADKGIAGVSADQRIKIAEQIMHTAANPSATDQGQHNTCGAAALESKTFASNPAEAAKMITDVALTGEYQTSTKPAKTIKPDLATLTAKNPEGHDYDYPPKSGVMSEAGRIFQVTAVTMEEPTYKQKTPSSPSDTGEQVTHMNDNDPFHSHTEKFSGLSTTQLQDIDQKITGNDISDQLIQNKFYQPDPSDGEAYCGSPEELGKQLADLKAKGKLPAVIQVDCGNEPFYSDSKGDYAGGKAALHFVTVTDYEPGPPAKVSVDNQWGKGCNHTGDNAIGLNELYRATLPPGSHEQITQLQSEIDDAKKNGQPTTELDLELARQKHIAQDPHDKISVAEYEKEVKTIMIDAVHRWDTEEGGAGVNEEERAQAWVKLINMLGDLDGKDKGAKAMVVAIGKEVQKSQKQHHHNMKKPTDYYKEFKDQVDE